MMQDPPSAAELERAAELLRRQAPTFAPTIGIVLGSGLGGACQPARIISEFPFADVPGLAPPAVAGHAGILRLVDWAGIQAMIFVGRSHFYEGHGWDRVVYPLRLARRLGASCMLLTNSSGSLRADFGPGTLVVLDDHINLIGSNPLVGTPPQPNEPMFPDLTAAYSPRLRSMLDRASQQTGVPIQHGVYAAMSGPNYETPAEVRLLGRLGADVVGMSTVGEAIWGRRAGLELAALSCVANLGAGLPAEGTLSHAEVLAAGQQNARRLATLLDAFMQELATDRSSTP